MLDLAIALDRQPVPRGERVAIITNAGGPGVLATDRAIGAGLRLAAFSPSTTAVLKKSLPAAANLANPVDLIGDARVERYRDAVTAALADDGVDGVLVLLTPQSMTDIPAIAAELCRLAGPAAGKGLAAGKPLYASFMGQSEVAVGAGLLERGGVPQYAQLEDMCDTYAGAWRFGLSLRALRAAGQSAPEAGAAAGALPLGARALLAAEPGRAWLPLDRALALLGRFGIPVPPQALAGSEEEAAAAAQKLGFPVALKAVCEQIPHKSDADAVRLGVADREEAAAAFRGIQEAVARVPGALLDGVLVQPMAAPGLELILGFRRDPAFGAAVLAGAGGTWVELLRDVSFRIPPFGGEEARAMLEELTLHPLLAGSRGRPALDALAAAGCILAVARLAQECPEIEELDCNPLVVYERGCLALDARMARRRT
jgi:acetyltransferase